jgi:hypothetical protein
MGGNRFENAVAVDSVVGVALAEADTWTEDRHRDDTPGGLAMIVRQASEYRLTGGAPIR